jgi:hypothetical protein
MQLARFLSRDDPMKPNKNILFLLFGIILTSTALACNFGKPPGQPPESGSEAEAIGKGNQRYEGTGNVTYLDCQDPTANVIVLIGEKTPLNDGFVNPVHISTLTEGSIVKGINGCEKSNPGETHDYPADGFYDPGEAEISFSTCTSQNHKARGTAVLGEGGFSGEYACYDKNTGDLMYKVAFSAYEKIR